MDWVSTCLTTRIDLQDHSVEEEGVAEWTRLRRSWLKPSSNPKYIFTSWSYFMSGFMQASMARDKLACCRNCCCIWARSVLSGWNSIVRGKFFRLHAVPNNEQSCWMFHVLGESCTTIVCSWTSGMRSTCTAKVSVAVLNRAARL